VSALFVSEKAPPTPLAAFVTLRWRGELYAARHVGEGQSAALGDGPDALAPLGDGDDVLLASTPNGVPTAHIPAGLRARLDGPDAPTRILLGPTAVALALGQRVELKLDVFVVRVEGSLREGRPRRTPRVLPTRVLLGGAALLQAALLAAATLAPGTAIQVGDADDDARTLRALWLASAERAEEASFEPSLGTEPGPREAEPAPLDEPLVCVGDAVSMPPPPSLEAQRRGALMALGGGVTVLAAGLGFVAFRRREKALGQGGVTSGR
jgi:hypothetical protein